ncbi:hypothetical protein PPS11_36475 [Pseudomonas putida S11]|nr:hypothetical protein PPS11_36475 [Pseudomonas putida S11]
MRWPSSQAYIFASGNGVGAHLQFLLGGDTRIGMAHGLPGRCRCRPAAPTPRNRLTWKTLRSQRNRVEGGQVAVQHAG